MSDFDDPIADGESDCVRPVHRTHFPNCGLHVLVHSSLRNVENLTDPSQADLPRATQPRTSISRAVSELSLDLAAGKLRASSNAYHQ
jgi:hypothetical protein